MGLRGANDSHPNRYSLKTEYITEFISSVGGHMTEFIAQSKFGKFSRLKNLHFQMYT